jgi:hypothetical protein
MRNTATEDGTKKVLEEGFVLVEKFDTEKGGIYVETTDDFRGWMLGDKTRKIYEVPDLYIQSLTDLLVVVVPNNDDGSEIRVSVYNPRDTARMLLSNNDDVGSSVQYAHIESPKPAELVAKMGCHICIESLMRGSWIRVQVFPGSDISEMISIDESEILKFLESRGTEKTKILADLVTKYHEMESEIDALLSRMERHGMNCNCDEPTIFKQIYEGKFEDVIQTCIECGGTVER